MQEKARYQDIKRQFEQIRFTTIPFSPAIFRLQGPEGHLPAIQIRTPLTPLEPHRKQSLQESIGSILGDHTWLPQLQQKVGTDGSLSGENTSAGWGHGFENMAVSLAVADVVGVPVTVFTAEELAGRFGLPYKIKLLGHAAIQHGEDVMRRITSENLVRDLVKDRIRILAAYLAFVLAGLDGKINNTTHVATLNNHRSLHKILLNISYWVNWRLFDRRMIEALDVFRSTTRIKGGYTANPATARDINDNSRTAPHRLIVKHVVDSGYGRTPEGKIIPETLMEFADKGHIPIAVPNKVTADVLSKYFDIHHAVVVGDNVGRLTDEKAILHKWRHTKKDRIVLASTSGHGANTQEINNITADFSRYRKIKKDSPYTCIVFVGHHDDRNPLARVSSLFKTTRDHDAAEIVARWDTPFDNFKKQVAAHKGKLILIRTEDARLTSIVKLWLQEISHIEAVKPGEAHVMNPHVATVTYQLTPAPPNEPFNGISALLKGGSIARSPVWPDYVQAYYKRLRYPQDQIDRLIKEIPGLLPQPKNIFDALDYFWGDSNTRREAGQCTIRQQAFKGFVEMDNATVPIMAIEIATALGREFTDEYVAHLRDNIARYLESEKERKKQLVESEFPDMQETPSQKKKSNNIAYFLTGSFAAGLVTGLVLARFTTRHSSK